MPRSSRHAARSRAKKAVPDPRAEIRRFITNLDRLAAGPFAPPVRRTEPQDKNGK